MAISDKLVRFRISGSEIQTIPKSQWARLLRYLWINRDRYSEVLEMIVDLDSSEVPPRLSQLQSRFGILVDKEQVPSSKKKRYRLSVLVEIVGEEENG